MSEKPSPNTSRSGSSSQAPSAPGSPAGHAAANPVVAEKTELLNIDALKHISKTRLKALMTERLRCDTVVLNDTAESESREAKESKDPKESKVLKVELYQAQDLPAIGKSIGDPYVYNKFLPIDPNLTVKMVTYCLTMQNAATFVVLLRKVRSAEPVVICPVYFKSGLDYPRLINGLTFNLLEWTPIKVPLRSIPLPVPKTAMKLPNKPEYEEAFRNVEKDFASDPYFYQGDCTEIQELKQIKKKEKEN